MSLIDLLVDENQCNNFLETKQSSINISQKELEKYSDFIINKRYKEIAERIANNLDK